MLYWFENWYSNINFEMNVRRWKISIKKKVGQGDNLWKKSNKFLYFILMKMYVCVLSLYIYIV